MAVATRTVKIELDRSELDEALADMEALAQQLEALRGKLNNLTLGIHLDMTGASAEKRT